jgi:hypothetical protein
MNAHALASPSSAAMWMACPASVTLAEGRVRPSSVYAKEGTAAHRIAEMIIGGNLFPPSKITIEGTEFVVGRDMLQHLNPYIDHVQALGLLGYKIRTEQKVRLYAAGGLVWGTADCVASRGKNLVVLDLKYGKGVPVGPDSAQLKIYALAAMETFRMKPSRITAVIHQPRLDPQPKSITWTFGELDGWDCYSLRPAIDRIVSGDTTEIVGSHCRWCVRRDECHAYAHQKSAAAADIFDDGMLDGVENIA